MHKIVERMSKKLYNNKYHVTYKWKERAHYEAKYYVSDDFGRWPWLQTARPYQQGGKAGCIIWWKVPHC